MTTPVLPENYNYEPSEADAKEGKSVSYEYLLPGTDGTSYKRVRNEIKDSKEVFAPKKTVETFVPTHSRSHSSSRSIPDKNPVSTATEPIIKEKNSIPLLRNDIPAVPVVSTKTDSVEPATVQSSAPFFENEKDTGRNRNIISGLIKFITVAIVVFIMLTYINPPFVQQQQDEVEKDNEEVFRHFAGPTDLKKSLVYGVVAGGLSIGIPFLWDYFNKTK